MVRPAETGGDADATRVYEVECAAGEYLFRAGEAAGLVYIIEEGQVELLLEAGSSRLAELGPGDLVGELGWLDERAQDASARATVASRLLKLDADTCERLLRQSPELALRLLRRLAQRLDEARRGALAAPAAAQPQPAAAPAPAVAAPPTPKRGRLVLPSGEAFALPDDGEAGVGRPSRGHSPEIDLSPHDGQRSLSRKHATLWRGGDAFYVKEESGVANGTFVNGRRLKPGEPVALKPGDEVCFGLVKTVFELA